MATSDKATAVTGGRKPRYTAHKATGAGVGGAIGTLIGGILDAYLADHLTPEMRGAVWSISAILGGMITTYAFPPNQIKPDVTR